MGHEECNYELDITESKTRGHLRRRELEEERQTQARSSSPVLSATCPSPPPPTYSTISSQPPVPDLSRAKMPRMGTFALTTPFKVTDDSLQSTPVVRRKGDETGDEAELGIDDAPAPAKKRRVE